ncbi:MAG: hypothetical protein J6B77_05895 [Clostridia bacterium]|nr:hypothetical protein [Clostridia bacterium]
MKEKRRQNRIRVRRITTCAILAALGVVLLYLGALVEVLDLSVGVLASLVCVFATVEMGGAWPWMVYAVVSILSLVLLPQKNPAVIFLLFGGYYPILKAYYERLRALPAWVLKLLHFNVALTAAFFLLKELFLAPDVAWMNGAIWAVIVYVAGNATFLLYDFALTRLISAYLRVFREKLRIRKL